tara:strand:- start:357 stop:1073 length:717 start_codon:yes stop_codon:yes gene_type:complete
MTQEEEPKQSLISSKFAWRLAFAVGIIFLATVIINLAGRYFSSSILMVGHTSSTERYNIVIGNNTLSIPANTIRFADQRRSGAAQGINLYMSWPEFQGYQETTQKAFNSVGEQSKLIFIDIAQNGNQGDMSSRFDPIYRNFLEGSPQPAPDGLVQYKMSPQSTYKNEVIYVEGVTKEMPFTIKCLVPNNQLESSTGCQRDINLGNGLSVTYRYSEQMIAHWRDIEQSVINAINTTIQK